MIDRFGPRGRLYAQRAIGGLALLLLHEWDSLCRHGIDVSERLAIARNSRSLPGLVRGQLDLLAETRARLAMDHQERRALLHGWFADLRG